MRVSWFGDGKGRVYTLEKCHHCPLQRRLTALIHYGQIQELDVLAEDVAGRTGEDKLGGQRGAVDLYTGCIVPWTGIQAGRIYFLRADNVRGRTKQSEKYRGEDAQEKGRGEHPTGRDLKIWAARMET